MPDEVKGSNLSSAGELSMDAAASRLMALGDEPSGDALPTGPEPDDRQDEAPDVAEPDTAEADAAELAPDAAAEADETGDEAPEAEAETDDDATTHVIRYKGKDVKVSTAELKSGYLKDLDYRRKTQELAQERRELAERAAQAEQVRQLYVERLHTLPTDADPEDGTDWAKASAEDPAGTQTRFFAYQARQQAKQQQAFMRQQEQAQVEQQRHQAFIRENGPKLVEFFPEWRDDARFQQDLPKLQKFVVENNVCPPAQMRYITPEQWRLAADAMAYRAQKAAAKAVPAKKVAQPAVPVQRPGVQPRKGEQVATQKAALVKQAMRSGRDEDAINALAAFL